jgi:hypothetical protein
VQHQNGFTVLSAHKFPDFINFFSTVSFEPGTLLLLNILIVLFVYKSTSSYNRRFSS